jgi:hypothetical protein
MAEEHDQHQTPRQDAHVGLSFDPWSVYPFAFHHLPSAHDLFKPKFPKPFFIIPQKTSD